MNLRAGDYLLCRFAHRLAGMLKRLGDFETDQLRERLRDVSIDRPVFVTGLARSGTTILLNVFSLLEPVGTHRYRDFPFLFLPVWWHRFNERAGRAGEVVERPHKDRITINRESPDAFEEPIWMHFFPFVHDPRASQVLTASHDNEAFNAFFKEHLRKILMLRGKRRYVSKGNYNITRLEYLAHLFPDARFVIPVRHPVTHVCSLVRQHRLFTDYSREDPRVPNYLRAAGHFEFGPQRVPINVDTDTTERILEAWREEDETLGYALTWRAVYAFAAGLKSAETDLARRMKFVRYEDLCRDPFAELSELLDFAGLGDEFERVGDALPAISPPQPVAHEDAEAERVWQETCSVAEYFDYQREEQSAIRQAR